MFELTPEKARSIAEAWCDAWNRRDLDAVMEHYADTAALCSPSVIKRWGISSGWIQGHTRLREHFAIGIAAEKLHFELIDVLIGAASLCIIYRRETGVLVSDTAELDDTGKIMRVVACYGTPV